MSVLLPIPLKYASLVQDSAGQKVAVNFHIHHAVLATLLVEYCPLATLGIKARLSRAGTMCATPGDDVCHAVASVLLTNYHRFASFGIGAPSPRAAILPTLSFVKTDITILSMMYAERCSSTTSDTSDVLRWVSLAGLMRTALAEDVHHAVRSMFPAERLHLPVLDIELRLLRPGDV